METAEEEKQAIEWEDLHRKVKETLLQFGREDYLGRAEYHLLGDNYGFQTINVAVHKLEMLRTPIVVLLQELLRDHIGWEILIAVDIPGKENLWPNMGLTIRAHEVIDELQRQYFPSEFQKLSFESRNRPTGAA